MPTSGLVVIRTPGSADRSEPGFRPAINAATPQQAAAGAIELGVARRRPETVERHDCMRGNRIEAIGANVAVPAGSRRTSDGSSGWTETTRSAPSTASSVTTAPARS